MKRAIISAFFFMLASAEGGATDPYSCAEREALQHIADGRPAEALQWWTSLPRAEFAFRSDLLGIWGIGANGNNRCMKLAECTPDFIDRQLQDLRRCADTGSLGGHILIGTVALTDQWNRRDLRVAERSLRKASKSRSALPSLGLSVVARKNGDAKLSRKRAEKAVARGAEIDNYLVGYMFKNGLLFKQDFNEAAFWFLRGVESKDWRAQAAMAYLYTTGQGVERNPEKAEELLRAVRQNPSSRSDDDLSGVITDVRGSDLGP